MSAKLDNPDELSAKETAVVAGISVDKLAVIESWQKENEGQGTFLAALAHSLAQTGGLKLEVLPADPVDRAVNVTPGAEKQRDR